MMRMFTVLKGRCILGFVWYTQGKYAMIMCGMLMIRLSSNAAVHSLTTVAL